MSRHDRRRLLSLAGAVAIEGLVPSGAGGKARAQPGPRPAATSPRAAPASSTRLDAARLEEVLARAESLGRLHALMIGQRGETVVERAFGGPGLDRPVNIKSISKSIIAALVGIAIGRGVLEGVGQPIAPILGRAVPSNVDPRVHSITIGDLLTMRAGLDRTSGPNYGAWVASRNWVAYALSRPFVDEPGGRMLYSTGSSHLLSAVLTRASGSSTHELARRWLGRPLDIAIPPWTRDPQGIFMGGNNMALSPRALFRFGETYRRRGVYAGRPVVPESWVEASWTPRTSSFFTGHDYGYGWFITRAGQRQVVYAWGYGGQMLYIVPDLELTVVMTSDASQPSGRDGYVQELHALLASGIVPTAERAG